MNFVLVFELCPVDRLVVRLEEVAVELSSSLHSPPL
jgi:hypothetical protein